MAKDLQFAGDYKLGPIVLYSASDPIDLRPLMLELNLYESVYSPNMYGNLVIRDSANHKQNAPIIGQEEIEFNLFLPENEEIDFRKYRMRVYKVAGHEETAEREQIYTLHFTTKEAVKNSRTTIKNAFEGGSDQIFARVMRDVIDTKKKLFVEPTSTNNKLLGNNMRPYDYLHMLAHRTSSRDFNGAGYLFYENHRGIHFRSWESLHRTKTDNVPSKIMYYVNPAGEPIVVDEDMRKIISYSIEKTQDTLAGHASGFFGSKHYNYSRIDKSLTIKESDYDQKFKRRFTTEGESFPMFPKTPEDATGKDFTDYKDARVFVSSFDKSLHTQSITDEKSYDNNDSIFQDRLHDKLDHDQIVLSVSVPGNTNLAAGDIVGINIPTYESIDNPGDRVYDLYLSGRYIITDLVHSVSENAYGCTFKCVRNDLVFPLPRGDESIEDRTVHVEPQDITVDVLGKAYIGESDEATEF
jgi:hypothetical protein